VRLATVLTDLPLTTDDPVDLAVDDSCASCHVCTTNCPPHAIFDVKQLVRGEERWYVDFDRCVPYFSEHQGCGICIEVCPWSEPGREPVISERMLGRRPSSEGCTRPTTPSAAK
jgi:epoxyqueuosine reductase